MTQKAKQYSRASELVRLSIIASTRRARRSPHATACDPCNCVVERRTTPREHTCDVRRRTAYASLVLSRNVFVYVVDMFVRVYC